MTKRAYRMTQNLVALVTLGVLFFSFYVQYVQGVQPCPLCMMQRFCVCTLMFLSLTGLVLKSLARAKYISLLQLIIGAAGLFFACRQLWLQSLPATASTVCMPGIDMLIHYFPWQELMHVFLWGTNTCTEVTWLGFGLSMAAWSALYFGTMVVISGMMFIQLRLNSNVTNTDS
jgi:disulfide bond formation protein DsbB